MEPAPARDRIIGAAARLFMARSFEAVGVAEICAAAKVQKGGFYHSFASKNDLVIAVIDHHAAKLWDLLDRLEGRRRSPVSKIRATADAVGDIQGRVYAFFGRIVGCPLGNLAVELSTIDAAARERVASIFEQWERRLARHCQNAADAGQLAPGVDPDHLAHQIIATMQGMILLAKASGAGPARDPQGDAQGHRLRAPAARRLS